MIMMSLKEMSYLMEISGGKKMSNYLTVEKLRDKFEEIDTGINSGEYGPNGTLSSPVLRRQLGIIFVGYFDQYNRLPNEDKEGFGFDVDSLFLKVKNLLSDDRR